MISCDSACDLGPCVSVFGVHILLNMEYSLVSKVEAILSFAVNQ
jgi:hypothetical protein